jgi:hypothetical protein
MLINGQITILTGENGVTIELNDEASGERFLTVELTSSQFCQALSRLAYTKCKKTEVRSLDRIGKKIDVQEIILELPHNNYETRKETAIKIAAEICPAGWIPDTYYGSQGSFWTKDGKYYARTHIRRWV